MGLRRICSNIGSNFFYPTNGLIMSRQRLISYPPSPHIYAKINDFKSKMAKGGFEPQKMTYETCGVILEDIILQKGSVLIRSGKGRKPRIVYLGKKSRRVLRAYLKSSSKQMEWNHNSALWVTNTHSRLTYWGINQIIRRRAEKANIEKPCLHDFRRAFALNFLRNGGDIYSLQNLMGHTDLQVLRRYLAQTTEDLQVAHQNFSPVDNAGL